MTGPRPHSRFDDEADAYKRRCGTRLKTARIAAGLTQKQLADAVGYYDNPGLIAHWENDGMLPQPPRQLALAAALRVPVEALFGWDGYGDHQPTVLLAARRAHYVCRYCIDGHHEACDAVCGLCSSPCRCETAEHTLNLIEEAVWRQSR